MVCVVTGVVNVTDDCLWLGYEGTTFVIIMVIDQINTDSMRDGIVKTSLAETTEPSFI